MTATLRTVLGVLALYGLLLLYLTPALVAAHRNAPGTPALLRRNIDLGWTGIVWLACLVVAARRCPRPAASAPSGPYPIRHDRVPTWVTELPRERGPWAALPRDTGPIDPRLAP